MNWWNGEIHSIEIPIDTIETNSEEDSTKPNFAIDCVYFRSNAE